MPVIEFLSPDHGYPLLVVIYINIMLTYLAIQVGKMRKKLNVNYPTMYSDKEPLFNCYQRAHQNTLESLISFYAVFIPVALAYPKIAAALGTIWVTSRFSYAWGYYTGDPKKRMNGGYGYIGLLGLFIMMIYVTLNLLGFVPTF